MRKLLIFILFAALFSANAQETELLQNAGFEQAKSNGLFGYEYEGWSVQGIVSKLNTTDKLEGNQAFESVELNQTSNWIQQAVDVQSLMSGDEFEVRVCYKVLSNPKSTAIRTDHYWDVYPSGRSAQDSVLLCDSLLDANSWQTITIRTKMPANAHYFHFRISLGKGMLVLLDNMSFHKIESKEAYLNFTPKSLPTITTEINKAISFPQIQFSQANLTSPTSLYITGPDAKYFTLSANKIENGDSQVTITYLPTVAGNHSAMLNIDNSSNPELNGTIPLHGTSIDKSKKPTIFVSPDKLNKFTSIAGQQQTQNLTIKSENCTDNIELKITHLEGYGFVVSSGMIAKNTESTITITFYPQEEGEYKSQLTISTQGGDDVVLFLEGTATQATPETVDWATDFSWDESNPLKQMEERFDDAIHNKTLQVKGWQNVADAKQRPWWGFDENISPNTQGTERYAKATSYQYQKDSTSTWQMWLVTPPLDYKNATKKVFTFSVMGENLPDTLCPTSLEIYYVDATNTTDVYWQNLNIEIPQTSDENLVWVPFSIDLTGQTNISDVFHIAFRYKGPNGGAGAVVYYIDDVTWSVEQSDKPEDNTPQDDDKQDNDALDNIEIKLNTNLPMYNILGIEVDSDYKGIIIQNNHKFLIY